MKKLQFAIVLAVAVAMTPQVHAGYLDPNATVPTSTPLQPPKEGIRPNLEGNINSAPEEEQAVMGSEQNAGESGSENQKPSSSGANSGNQPLKSGAVNWKVVTLTAGAAALILIFYAFYRKHSRD